MPIRQMTELEDLWVEPKYSIINFFDLEDMTYQYLLQAIKVADENSRQISKVNQILDILAQNYIYSDKEQIVEALFFIRKYEGVKAYCKNRNKDFQRILTFCGELWLFKLDKVSDIDHYVSPYIGESYLKRPIRVQIYYLTKSWNFLKNIQTDLDIGRRNIEVPFINTKILFFNNDISI